MTLEDVRNLKEEHICPVPIITCRKFQGHLVVNKKIAVAVEITAAYFFPNLDISVFNEAGEEVGILTFTKGLGTIKWNELTENQFIAFLTEASYGEHLLEYRFEYSYLVINANFYGLYMEKYAHTSMIWGGFSHILETPMQGYKTVVNRIEMKSLNLRGAIFRENAVRSILQPFAFERFLKSYHLLELRFDSEIIEEIKTLDIERKSETIAEILNNYNRKEIDRLTHIIDRYCNDIPRLVYLMNQVSSFLPIAQKIFYVFGKEGNPLKEESKFNSLCARGFDERSLKKENLINPNSPFNKFIKKLVSYWIYRVRCCIAHNRIGEFVLSHHDESFVVNFAEPLLKEVVMQCFKA